MKIQFLSIIIAFLPIAAVAQITVSEYEMKVTVNIDELDLMTMPSATSSCGVVNVSFTDQVFSGGCLGTLSRTYTFTDDCGNSASAMQFILLEDTVPPVFNVSPEDFSLSASESTEATIPTVTATDNSMKEVKITFHEFNSGGSITRSWTAEDDCGNVEVMKQVITIK